MTYKYEKLLGLMREHGYTQEALAKRLGISSVTLRNKIYNKTDFTRTEIDIMRSLFDIKDLVPVFFTR